MKLIAKSQTLARFVILVWAKDDAPAIPSLGYYTREDAERAAKNAIGSGAIRAFVTEITDRFQLGRTVVRVSED